MLVHFNETEAVEKASFEILVTTVVATNYKMHEYSVKNFFSYSRFCLVCCGWSQGRCAETFCSSLHLSIDES